MNTLNDINSQIADCRPVVYQCEECGEPIRADDAYYSLGGNAYCENCVDHSRHYAENWEDYSYGEEF